jgi:methanogenic corrinoid protein MtbC1
MDIELYRSQFEKALFDMDRDQAFNVVHTILETHDLDYLIDHILVDVLKNIGEQWEKGSISLAQIYMSGKICEGIIDQITPTKSISKKYTAKIAITTLEDHHALGKRIVISMLKSSGFKLIDYGHGLDVASLVEKVKRDKVNILLISTLMYPSALKVKEVREAFEKMNYSLKILVGGAPFVLDKTLWKQVKADAMGESASDAIYFLEKWTKEENNNE